uniref:Uncharacterized protein n=1 Tax=Magnetospirillum gryphiswaldense TaxID=55518 RepID=A4U5P7_9PROT|nr:hypothetical protein MGR_4272 [Magnetospirillum gryphiswaldense MSR-1]
MLATKVGYGLLNDGAPYTSASFLRGQVAASILLRRKVGGGQLDPRSLLPTGMAVRQSPPRRRSAQGRRPRIPSPHCGRRRLAQKNRIIGNCLCFWHWLVCSSFRRSRCENVP